MLVTNFLCETRGERPLPTLIYLIVLFFLFSPLLHAGEMPDPILTPGVSTGIGVDEICSTKWGKDKRHVTASMKREVFARYGLKGNTCAPDKHGRHCEIDHLISRELGGADDILNLWPQPYGGKLNASDKDRVENKLHKEVCEGVITLEDAQDEIRIDWRIAYRRYFGQPK